MTVLKMVGDCEDIDCFRSHKDENVPASKGNHWLGFRVLWADLFKGSAQLDMTYHEHLLFGVQMMIKWRWLF